MAGFASGNAAAPNAPALPSKTRRREMIIGCSLNMFYRRPSLLRASGLDRPVCRLAQSGMTIER
jgi:hypothetical protein